MTRTRRTRWHAPVAFVTCIALLAGTLPAARARADEPAPRASDEVLSVESPAAGASHATSAAASEATPARSSTGAQVAPAESEAARAAANAAAEPKEEAAVAARSPGAAAPIAAAASRKPALSQGPSTVDSTPVSGSDKTGVSSQAISLPQGTGKIQGMGESFSTDLSTGVASFTVPFSLVPARGGAQPSLALHYSSGSGHGIAGVGWDAGVPYIARQTDRGIPQYQDPSKGGAWASSQDRFVFSGGQELVPICLVSGGSCTGMLPNEVMPTWSNGWQYFRARVEGAYMRFFWSADHRTWRVQSKTGESMELGAPLDSSGDASGLEVDPDHPSHVFRWNLVRQYDAYGGANPTDSTTLPTPVNVVVYRYLHDGGMAYLSDIYDTPPKANPTTAPLSAYGHHAHLTYGARTDVTSNFRRGWQVTTAKRLTGLDVTSEDFGDSGTRLLVRRYHLAYDPAYHVSLLTSVQIEGRCATDVPENSTGVLPASTGCPTLPAMTFSYQHVTGYDATGNPLAGDLTGYEAFDERVVPMSGSPPNSIDETEADLFDINADGLPDVLVTSPGLYSGDHGVFFNGAGGKASSFGPAALMPVTGVLGETASTLTLDNLNVSALDLDGDGLIDLLHMPLVKTYSIYTPQGSGTKYAWVGRSVTTASQQSPKLDFGSDTPEINLLDVNGDGLVDQVLTTGTDIETFFSLGRYPNGDGQFGYAQWSGPASASITNSFVSMCLPYSGTPIRFSDPDIKIADMNGDGLPDIVRVDQGNIRYWPGRGNGFWGTGDPTNCPGGSFAQGLEIAMDNAPEFSDPSGSNLRVDDVNGDGLADLVQVGFNDIEIWLNVDGTSWTAEHIISNAPAEPSYLNRVRLVDVNGSGTRGIIWGDGGAYKYMDLSGGRQPWLLTHVANGLGKTSDFQYSNSTQLMLAAEAAGQPWTSKSPMPMTVITQVTESDHLDVIGLPPGNYVTQFTYRDPVYDGRQREFRGFRTASERKVGDANSPSSTSTQTFLLGECVNDENVSPDPCTPAGRWEDNPREALKGLPLASDTFDDNGVYLSTKHTTYRLRKLYAGLDGREVRVAFPSGSDSFLYDTGAFTPAASTTSVTDVELETTLGTVSPDTTSALTLRATAGRAHLQTNSVVDPFGNATDVIDAGCVDGCASVDQSIIGSASDEVITKHATPGRRTDCDNSGWMWRTVESSVTGSFTSGVLDDHLVQYDCGGSPTQTTGVLQGTLPLDRHHEMGLPVAQVPPQASQDGPILLSAMVYDTFGVLVQSSASNGRCHSTVSDGSFDELPIVETEYVGTAGSDGCGQTALPTTVQDYDRGFGVIKQVTDPNGELTTATYDGFGRMASLSKPDPAAVGSSSAFPGVQIEYILPTNAATTPYSVVLTNLLTDIQNGSNGSQPTYRQTLATIDGLGRPILNADQADPAAGDGGPWIVEKLTTHDGKGAVAVAYQPWFAAQTPPSPPVAPPTAYSHARFDAFGRALETYNIDGALSLRSVYHALSADHWDAADLQAGGAHQGTFASEVKDGHGRPIITTERLHNGTSIEAHDTRTQFRPTGQPLVISRVRVNAPDAPVVRWLQYDSLGRIVLNMEPDTTAGYVGPPTTFGATPAAIPNTTHAWRYAYDNNGDLVGTSDARGCGANYHYDAGGRIVAEDFSPCLASQQLYSQPDLSTGDKTEAFYQYDDYTGIDLPQSNAPGFPPAGLARGHLVSTSDRGARTVTSYDGRGRTVAVARLVAGPGGPSDTLSDRYDPTWSIRNFTYDEADRPLTTATGADVSELLPNGNPTSAVATQYSARGSIRSVTSSYGPLVSSVTRDADGLVNQVVYGDTAGTTSAFTYDVRRRLASVQTYRGPPALWSQTPPAYLPAPDPGGSPSTFQLLLEDADYHYDVVDNPVEIDDWRIPSEWPAGAQPVSRKIQYDDLYRTTRVDYVYPGAGTDPWTSPFDAEDTNEATDPRLGKPSTHVSFTNRVLRQTFQYDWLGNTTVTDDDAHGFYDRSLGVATNGAAGAGPYQLQGAAGADPTRGGSLTTVYDADGNLGSLAINRGGPCLPSGSNCTQRFVYDWDEVGRLVRARRWDLGSPVAATDAAPSGPTAADLAYSYDSNDGRVLKVASDGSGNRQATVYIFSSLELREAADDGTRWTRDASTEVVYLEAHGVRLARVQAAIEAIPSENGLSPHVLLEMPDHLGSTSIVIDRDTSELVERGTYMAYGQADSDYRSARWGYFREDYRFTGKEEDVEVGLQYFGKRYYAPGLERWVSPDPLTVHELGSDLNAYAYVHGGPLKAVDPLGLAENGNSSYVGTDEPASDPVAQGMSSQDYQQKPVEGAPPPSCQVCTECSVNGEAATPDGAGAQSVDTLHNEVRWNPNAKNPTDAMLLGSKSPATLKDTDPQLYAKLQQIATDTKRAAKIVWEVAQVAQPELMAVQAVITIADPDATAGEKTLAVVSVIPFGRLAELASAAADGKVLTEGIKEYDVLRYGDKAAGLEKHHGVMDKWATENVDGYVSRGDNTPAIALSKDNHGATKAVFRDWLEGQTGKRVGGSVDWKAVSPQEIQTLTEKMFDAAKVPAEARAAYYRAFNQYIYNVKEN